MPATRHNASICTIPVDKMETGFFWARAHTIKGVTEEEGIAYLNGKLPPDEALKVSELSVASLIELRDADVPGVQYWMTPRRAAS